MMQPAQVPLTALAEPHTPTIWAKGNHFPRNEPGFSRRMLAEYVSQAQNAVSHRYETVDWRAAAIGRLLPPGRPARRMQKKEAVCCRIF
jgi:hypothetical protein